jgi:hypothetical protein
VRPQFRNEPKDVNRRMHPLSRMLAAAGLAITKVLEPKASRGPQRIAEEREMFRGLLLQLPAPERRSFRSALGRAGRLASLLLRTHSRPPEVGIKTAPIATLVRSTPSSGLPMEGGALALLMRLVGTSRLTAAIPLVDDFVAALAKADKAGARSEKVADRTLGHWRP